jgi:hypothetical protein
LCVFLKNGYLTPSIRLSKLVIVGILSTCDIALVRIVIDTYILVEFASFYLICFRASPGSPVGSEDKSYDDARLRMGASCVGLVEFRYKGEPPVIVARHCAALW